MLRLNRYNLDSDEVRDHVRQGLLPTRLGLSWQGVASFVLTDTLKLRRIEIADVTAPAEASTSQPAMVFGISPINTTSTTSKPGPTHMPKPGSWG